MVQHVEQELLYLQEYLSSPAVLMGFVWLDLLFSVQYFVDRCLFFFFFIIYGFWSPLWYLQTVFLETTSTSKIQIYATLRYIEWMANIIFHLRFCCSNILLSWTVEIEKLGKLHEYTATLPTILQSWITWYTVCACAKHDTWKLFNQISLAFSIWSCQSSNSVVFLFFYFINNTQ